MKNEQKKEIEEENTDAAESNCTPDRNGISENPQSCLGASPKMEQRRSHRAWRHRELIARGCSRRALAKELGQSPTTIRRHVDLASMSDEYRFKVQNGASAKKTLAVKALADRTERKRGRILEENKSGKHSNEIADLILYFCRGNDGIPETPTCKVDVPQLLDEVRSYLNRYATFGRRSPKISKKRGLTALFRFVRPPDRNRFPLDHKAEWLANVIWVRCREELVWDNALNKARKRAGELEPKKTPSEAFREKFVANQLKVLTLSP